MSKQQQGLSIVELMVALALCSFLILGISQIYVDNKRTYLFQQSQAMNLDSARFVDHILTDLLGKAGYLRSNRQILEDLPATAGLSTHCNNFAKGHAVTSLKSGQGLCLRYQPAVNGELNCASNSQELDNQNAFTPPNSSEIVYVALRFVPDDTNLENGVIQCIDKDSVAELIRGVADFQIEFGVGKSGDEKSLNENSPWKLPSAWVATLGPVRAVRYSVLLASTANQRNGDSAVFTDWLDNHASSRKDLLEDNDKRRIYQIASGSQALRNLNL